MAEKSAVIDGIRDSVGLIRLWITNMCAPLKVFVWIRGREGGRKNGDSASGGYDEGGMV